MKENDWCHSVLIVSYCHYLSFLHLNNVKKIVIKHKNLRLYHVKNKKIACNHNAHTNSELLREKAIIENNEVLLLNLSCWRYASYF